MISLGKILYCIKSVRFIPHLYVIAKSPIKELLDYERDRWLEFNNIKESGRQGYISLFMQFPEYRSLFYHRTGKTFLRRLAAGQTNLYFHTPQDKIGRGLIIWHGYSTVINAQWIGTDVQIWHNVTLGKKSIKPIEDRPIIGNNVSICTGAIVLGNISIADNSTVGAGTVVTKSVPKKGSTVIGAKQQII